MVPRVHADPGFPSPSEANALIRCNASTLTAKLPNLPRAQLLVMSLNRRNYHNAMKAREATGCHTLGLSRADRRELEFAAATLMTLVALFLISAVDGGP